MEASPTPKPEAVPAEYHEAITATRRDLTTLGACWREFLKHFSGWAVSIALLASIVAWFVVGEWTYYDLLVPVVIIAIQPFVEWIIHKYLLHLKPFELRGHKFDLYTAKAHRRHHKAPAELDRVLLHASEIIASMVLIAITAYLVVAVPIAIFGGNTLQLWLTALVCSYAGLLRYEWSHFLIHTPYIPKTRFFRSIWRSHRLHHFKHEDYWLGVSSNFGDRALGTFPDQAKVPKSPTARTLGVTTERYDGN
jgi:sterol desaturase/sphingolipid hydroxylase (fatty acid hydroxylase superfamily)